jgi:SAM-dependent methyltransferase
MKNLLDFPGFEPVLRDYNHRMYVMNRCQRCGFMQPAALPSHPEYFNALYDLKWSPEWMAEDFSLGYKDAIFRTILGALARRVPAGTRTLQDVGTHVGRMLELARQAGWRPEVIELNTGTATFAAQRTGLPVHRKNAKDLATTGVRYDAVVLTDVLEHIPDPLPVLMNLRSLLKPGGWIAVKVPCGASQLLKQRIRHWFDKRHDPDIGVNFVRVNHFGPRSLTEVLRRAGFDTIRIGVGAPEYPLGGGLKGLMSRAFRSAVYTVARFPPFGTRTPLAMNLQAYARNPAG